MIFRGAWGAELFGSFHGDNYAALLFYSKSFTSLLHSNLFSANFKFFSILFSLVISETVSINLIFFLPHSINDSLTKNHAKSISWLSFLEILA